MTCGSSENQALAPDTWGEATQAGPGPPGTDRHTIPAPFAPVNAPSNPAAAGAQVLSYSTFLHGTDLDFVVDLAVDDDGVMTVAGYTYATDFPTTPGALQTTYTATNLMSFVSRLDAALPPAEQLL